MGTWVVHLSVASSTLDAAGEPDKSTLCGPSHKEWVWGSDPDTPSVRTCHFEFPIQPDERTGDPQDWEGQIKVWSVQHVKSHSNHATCGDTPGSFTHTRQTGQVKKCENASLNSKSNHTSRFWGTHRGSGRGDRGSAPFGSQTICLLTKRCATWGVQVI